MRRDIKRFSVIMFSLGTAPMISSSFGAQAPECKKPIASYKSYRYDESKVARFYSEAGLSKSDSFVVFDDGKKAAGIECANDQCTMTEYALDPIPETVIAKYEFTKSLKTGYLLMPRVFKRTNALVLQITSAEKTDSSAHPNEGSYLIFENLKTKGISDPKKVYFYNWGDVLARYPLDSDPPDPKISKNKWTILQYRDASGKLMLKDFESQTSVLIPEWPKDTEATVTVLNDGSILLEAASYLRLPPLRIWPEISCGDQAVAIVATPDCEGRKGESDIPETPGLKPLRESAVLNPLCTESATEKEWMQFTGPEKKTMTPQEMKRFLIRFQKPGEFKPETDLKIMMGALSHNFAKTADNSSRAALKEALLTVFSERPVLYEELNRIAAANLQAALSVKSDQSPCLPKGRKKARSLALQALLLSQPPIEFQKDRLAPCPDFALIKKFGFTEKPDPDSLSELYRSDSGYFSDCPGFNQLPPYLTYFRSVQASKAVFEPAKHSLCFANNGVGKDLSYLAAKEVSNYGACAGMSAIHAAFFKQAKFNTKRPKDSPGAIFRKSRELMERFFNGCGGTVEFNGYPDLQNLCNSYLSDPENKKLFQDIAVDAQNAANITSVREYAEFYDWYYTSSNAHSNSGSKEKDLFQKMTGFSSDIDFEKFTHQQKKKSSDQIKRALISMHRSLKKGEPAIMSWLTPRHAVTAVSIEERTDPENPKKVVSYRVGFIDPNSPGRESFLFINVSKDGLYSSEHGSIWDSTPRETNPNVCDQYRSRSPEERDFPSGF